MLYFVSVLCNNGPLHWEPCKASRSAGVFCGLTIHLSLTLKSVNRYEGVHGYQQRTEMLMILKSTKPTPKKLQRTRVLQEHLKASTSIYTYTPYLGLYFCVPHPVYSVNYSSPSPPKDMKKWILYSGRLFKCHHTGWSLWLANQKQSFDFTGCLGGDDLQGHIYGLKQSSTLLEICTSSKIVCTGHYFTKVGADALRAAPPMLSM
jgi:hypothetical protein